MCFGSLGWPQWYELQRSERRQGPLRTGCQLGPRETEVASLLDGMRDHQYMFGTSWQPATSSVHPRLSASQLLDKIAKADLVLNRPSVEYQQQPLSNFRIKQVLPVSHLLPCIHVHQMTFPSILSSTSHLPN
jgi:hypothetical protein